MQKVGGSNLDGTTKFGLRADVPTVRHTRDLLAGTTAKARLKKVRPCYP